jgi:hypothetical protein
MTKHVAMNAFTIPTPPYHHDFFDGEDIFDIGNAMINDIN